MISMLEKEDNIFLFLSTLQSRQEEVETSTQEHKPISDMTMVRETDTWHLLLKKQMGETIASS